MWENFWLKSTHIWLWVASVMSFSLKQRKENMSNASYKWFQSLRPFILWAWTKCTLSHTLLETQLTTRHVTWDKNIILSFCFLSVTICRAPAKCVRKTIITRKCRSCHMHTHARSRCSQTTFAYYSRSHTRAETIMGSLRQKKKKMAPV